MFNRRGFFGRLLGLAAAPIAAEQVLAEEVKPKVEHCHPFSGQLVGSGFGPLRPIVCSGAICSGSFRIQYFPR